MSSQSKRRAESEEVAHKKKPRKGDEEDEFNQNEDDRLEVEDGKSGALDENNIIPTNRRTRGKRIDYAEDGILGNENGSKYGEEIPKDKTGVLARPQARSPERKPESNIENIEEEDDNDDDEEDEYGSDGGGDEDEGDYDEDDDDDE